MPRRRSLPAALANKYPRIPFAEAVKSDLLFKKGWEQLSSAQRAVLKMIYSQPLDKDELRLWSAFNGYGVYDTLGHLVDLTGELPYNPNEEFEDITLVFGRRSGKSTNVASFVVAYEALCGGHKEYLINRSQDPVFMQVAQDLETAKSNLRQYIRNWLEESPVGAAELAKREDAITADSIRLDSGIIRVGPPTIKLRGTSMPVCAMDELAVWPKDKEAANPDVEVENAVRPAMAQFPHRKLIKVSTPWTEEGLLWQAHQIGTQGRLLKDHDPAKFAAKKRLVLRAPTAALNNPSVPKSYLMQEQAKDGDAFRREYLAEFAKSATGFLSPPLLRAAVDSQVVHRPPQPGIHYLASMDPAFRRDAFAFCIGHIKQGIFILDYLNVARGTKDNPVPPRDRIREVANVCKHYGISHVVTDQYADLAVQALGHEFNLTIWPQPMTNKLKVDIWADFNTMLNQRRIRLLDDPALLDELMGMERILMASGNVRIEGKRDDRATVVATTLHSAVQIGDVNVEPVEVKKKTILDEIDEDVMGRSRRHESPWWNA